MSNFFRFKLEIQRYDQTVQSTNDLDTDSKFISQQH